jgi:hypothetical protein
MRVTYLLFFLSLPLFSQTGHKIEVIPNPKTIEDFDHQYKGCLENSECDQVMGLQLTRWKTLISKIKDEKVESRKTQFLELFRAKFGIPVEFYTVQKSQQGFKPLLFNSSCKEHNPKTGEKILRGTSFLKSLSKDKAVVWRDQAQIEVPVGELLLPQTVTVYFDGGPVTYELPLNDQPLFIKGGDLYVLKEEDNFFYNLKISKSGEWKIENLDLSKISELEDKKENVTCPKDATKLTPKVFGVEFCKSVWNEDQKKLVVVKMHQGCAI